MTLLIAPILFQHDLFDGYMFYFLIISIHHYFIGCKKYGQGHHHDGNVKFIIRDIPHIPKYNINRYPKKYILIHSPKNKAKIRYWPVAAKNCTEAFLLGIAKDPHHNHCLFVAVHYSRYGEKQGSKCQNKANDQHNDTHHFTGKLLHAQGHLRHGGKAEGSEKNKEYKDFSGS